MSNSHFNLRQPAFSTVWSGAAAPANVAPNANLAKPADSGDTTTISVGDFNDRAGVKPGGQARHNRVSLAERLGQRKPGRLPMRRTSNATHLNAADSDEHLDAASSDVLGALHSGGRSDLEDRLADSYDALERHALLRYARAKVDESDFSPTEKERLKNDLKGMLDELMDKHGDVIRAGLENKEAFESALGKMDALSAGSKAEDHTGSLTELRALYGSRSPGKTEMGLTPMGLAKSLVERFGAANFIGALGGLRSKMAADFRTRPADRPGPRLWLSLTDASSFNVVQTSFALAGDLRRDLSARAKVVGKANQAETALALLGATEPGRGRADPLVAHIADSKLLDALQQMYLYRLTGQAVEKMPMTAWPKDSAQRANLLDELRTLASDVCDKMPRAATAAEQLEQKMRGTVLGKRKRGQDDAGHGGDELQMRGTVLGQRKRDQDDADHGRDEPQSDDDRQTLVAREGA